MPTMNTVLAFALVCIPMVMGHPYYRERIPNGYSVPDPCSGGIWEAVGHYDPLHHTIQKNPFAIAFQGQGHLWTVTLCQMDSDGDGRTNGEELGDPNCVWMTGLTPEGRATGHPGLCEPIGSCGTFTCGCHGQNCVGK